MVDLEPARDAFAEQAEAREQDQAVRPER